MVRIYEQFKNLDNNYEDYEIILLAEFSDYEDPVICLIDYLKILKKEEYIENIQFIQNGVVEIILDDNRLLISELD